MAKYSRDANDDDDDWWPDEKMMLHSVSALSFFCD
jgi:hypothetical protein